MTIEQAASLLQLAFEELQRHGAYRVTCGCEGIRVQTEARAIATMPGDVSIVHNQNATYYPYTVSKVVDGIEYFDCLTEETLLAAGYTLDQVQ